MPPLPPSFPLPIGLDPGSPTPLYRQLAEWFRQAILAGRLHPGQRVPSTRRLADELKVSRIPVLGAYEQLLAEGYLESFTGAGTCVARAIPGESLKRAAGRSRQAVPAAHRRGARRISRRAAAMPVLEQPWLKNLGAFRIGLPAVDRFPMGIWAQLVNRHVRRQALEIMGYGGPLGYPPLRAAIADYLSAMRAVKCDADQIMVTTGSQQGLQLSAQVLLDAGDEAWVEEPGYLGARQALLAVGAKPVPVPVDTEGLKVADGIRRGREAHAAYITPSHQFPLGMTMSAARRMSLLNWATESGAWIIEDDYDSEYRFGGRPVASLQGMDADERVIYVGTFSKVMFPALRVGYVVIPKDLVPGFAVARDAGDTFSSSLHQLVMADFISEGHFARHIRRMRTLYMERRTTLVAAIAAELPERLEVVGGETGMHLVALLPPGVDDIAVTRAAAARGVSVRPLSQCYIRPPQRGGLILGFGGAASRDIPEAIRRLKTCI